MSQFILNKNDLLISRAVKVASLELDILHAVIPSYFIVMFDGVMHIVGL